MGGNLNPDLDRRLEILDRLKENYPGTPQELCELHFESPYQLLVATILSAQCTDQRVNATTPILFEKFGTPEKMATASREELEGLIYSTGFYRNKAKNILEMTNAILSKHNGGVPDSMEELSNLPGVGRKTANVVLSVAFCKPGLPVDTHVGRLALRLGLTSEKDPTKVEHELMSWVPPEESGGLSLRLILHGRRICLARKPKCSVCFLSDICPSTLDSRIVEP